MYEDITQNNYAPIYDSRGQIIGTVNPKTGQLEKEVVQLAWARFLQ